MGHSYTKTCAAFLKLTMNGGPAVARQTPVGKRLLCQQESSLCEDSTDWRAEWAGARRFLLWKNQEEEEAKHGPSWRQLLSTATDFFAH